MSEPVKLGELADLSRLDEMVKQKMIARKESDDGRVLYDYTHVAQFSKTWNNETRLCRGLVTDENGVILGRPFRKFFNLGEIDVELPDEPFEVFDKLDGSLIIAYLWHGGLGVNTRGSFVSDQAIAAKAWLDGRGFVPEEGVTYCFEWIAPDNRIVVNYGDRRECVFLDLLDNRTGQSIESDWSGARATKVSANRFDELPDRDDAEGYVVRFQSGLRVKIKHPRYVQIHRALNGLNEHRVWEMLSGGTSLTELYEILPDESYDWLKDVEQRLVNAYNEIERAASESWRVLPSSSNRKAFALEAVKLPYRSVLFALADKKDYSKHIWMMIEPKKENQ